MLDQSTINDISKIIKYLNFQHVSLTETVIKSNQDANFIQRRCPTGFSYISAPREGRIGGGLDLFDSSLETQSFKHTNLRLRRFFQYLLKPLLILLAIYCPPGSNRYEFVGDLSPLMHEALYCMMRLLFDMLIFGDSKIPKLPLNWSPVTVVTQRCRSQLAFFSL